MPTNRVTKQILLLLALVVTTCQGARAAEESMEEFTGRREMDASAIIDYFEPLMAWLEEQNHGRTCGW